MSILRKIPTILGAGGGSVPAWRQHLQPCEYLETDGNSYINLNYYANSNDVIKCRTKYFFYNEANYLYGCRHSLRDREFLCLYNNNKIIRLDTGNYADNISFSNADNNLIIYHDAKNKTAKIYNFDNTLLKQVSLPYTDNYFICDDFFTLFATNFHGSINYMKNGGRILNFEIIDEIKLISCYVIDEYEDNKGNLCSSGVAGMVDTLTGTFYTNDGTGNFTHGNDINI